jgi:hypothetical protein
MGEIKMLKSIGVSEGLKDRLDAIKVHPRETYEQVLFRLLEIVGKSEIR